KLSDINTEKKCWVDQVETATQYQPPFERVPVHQQFDEMQRETFETRQIVTGNLLSSPVGKKYINFTNNQGQVRQGLLLPRGYDIEQAMETMPVVLKTRAQQQEFLARAAGAKLLTTDEVLRVADTVLPAQKGAATVPGLLIEIQSSKRGGGKYFKDPELMALTEQGEFEKRGQVMRGYIRSERTEAFLEVLEQKFPGQKLAVFADAFKPMARAITGESLQKMDWFKEDQPLDLAAQELEISTEGVAARIADQKEQAHTKAQQERQNQALQTGDLDAAQPAGAAQAQEMPQHPDLEKLTQAFEAHFSSGGGFERITEARKFAITTLQQDDSDLASTLTNKQVDECVEKSLVRVAREIAQSSDPLEGFDQLVELYDRQPNLSSRTSTSIIHQQYSTPVPIGRLVQQLGDITPETTVYEPTAGNGSLLSHADPERAIVNELDPRRAEELEAQGFEPTTHDATEYAPEKKSVERVILNPPFGAVTDPETQQTKRWMIALDDPAEGTRPYETSAVDHAISFKALSAMQDDGKAVLVLGAPMEQKMSAEANAAYNEGQTRSFFYTLYNNYNVTDHFTIAGDLYQKQGTSFPIDVVVIDGRGKSDLELPAVKTPPVYRTWDELRQVMEESVGLQQQQQGKAMEIQQSDAIPEILPAKEQKGAAERNVAKLLHLSGLAEAIAHAPEGEFHLRIENEPYIPLVVEQHGEELYLTHYRHDDYDGAVMDGEMVFRRSEEGQLTLQETAVQNPFTGGESRRLDRGFAQTFSRNLLDQGFAEAATLALAEQIAQTEQRQQQQVAQAEDAENGLAIQADALEPVASEEVQQEPSEEQASVAAVDAGSASPESDVSSPSETQENQATVEVNYLKNNGLYTDGQQLTEQPFPLNSAQIDHHLDREQERGLSYEVEPATLEVHASEAETWREAGYQVHDADAPLQEPLPEDERPTAVESEVVESEVVEDSPARPGSPKQREEALLTELKQNHVQPVLLEMPKELEGARTGRGDGLTQSNWDAPPPASQKAMAVTQAVMQQHDPATSAQLSAPADSQAYSPSLAALRTWFASAKELGRDADHVAAIAQEMLKGSPEAEKPNAQRDPNYKNPGFTLPPEDLQTMKEDITDARAKRALGACETILKRFGKPDPENPDVVQFAKEKGDLVIGFDRKSHTLTAYSREQQRTLLTAVGGQVQAGESQDVKLLDQRVTKFLEKTQTQQRKQAQSMER
ncbi:MAG TPA: hypothetical protein V6D18_00790, partial [Thermosynechococcaceae cyanobacterium]